MSEIDPPSPCVDICTVDPGGRYCLGCLRTLDEIAAWGGLDAVRKQSLLDELERRAEQLFDSGGDVKS